MVHAAAALVLFSVLSVKGMLTVEAQFRSFMQEHGRSYEGKEFSFRLKTFQDNLLELDKHRANSPSSTHGINQFTDMTEDEFRHWTGYKPINAADLTRVCLSGTVPPLLDVADLPAAFDWRDNDVPVVTPVKNQGGCGSCWTFSAIGNIEGQWALAGNDLVSLSEQSILDCSTGCITHMGQHVCNQGCGGGWQFVAFNDMIPFGIPSEKDYPYKGAAGDCHATMATAAAKIRNFTCITPTDGTGADEEQMAAWLVANGPMAIAMDVSSIGSYTGGVFDPVSCSTTDLDHALLIVGYGTDAESGKDYWIIKNSWGASWGNEGYFNLVRGKGACGVNNAVSSAVV